MADLPEPKSRKECYLAKAAGMDVAVPAEPKSRIEQYLALIAGEDGEAPADGPKSRLELFLAKMAGEDVETPEPESRLELYLANAAGATGVQLPERPENRIEVYLIGIAENGGGGGGGDIEGWGIVTYLDGDELKTATMQNATEYEGLCGNTGIAYPLIVDGIEIQKESVVKIELGTLATYAGDHFCGVIPNLEVVTGTKHLQSIGISFLSGKNYLNCDIDLSNVENIPVNCLYNNKIFNSNVKLEKVTTIGDSFLMSCTTFNKPLSIPDSVTTIGAHFLRDCWEFNQNMVLPSALTSIGNYFMATCKAFSKPLEIPATVNSVGSRILTNSNNFIGPLICNAPSDGTKITNHNGSLSTTMSDAPMYVTGITLTGTYASVWKDRLADRTTSPYRKLIVAS